MLNLTIHMKKVITLIIVLVVLGGGILLYFNQKTANKTGVQVEINPNIIAANDILAAFPDVRNNAELDCTKYASIDECRTDYAKKEKNPKYCITLIAGDTQAYCLLSVVRITKDTNLCKIPAGASIHTACEAVADSNVGKCDEIERNDFSKSEITYCYSFVAADTNNAVICNSLSDQLQYVSCISEVAATNNEIQTCENILQKNYTFSTQNESRRSYAAVCIGQVVKASANPRVVMCDTLTDFSLKESCYSAIERALP
jgi:hypothetical protein